MFSVEDPNSDSGSQNFRQTASAKKRWPFCCNILRAVLQAKANGPMVRRSVEHYIHRQAAVPVPIPVPVIRKLPLSCLVANSGARSVKRTNNKPANVATPAQYEL
ncbi:uncharacterized protein CTRU02_214722 [Colletotrichum truncatum]|uniref:Uncharacterized protein n=1 Tax=Colletotrichum truncatum TaxID=5467 RepID=A0ACC3YGW5_COLTU|nr:uncharacterized protein CTRU02_09667 [Colletotrichum truncatum]KAF6788349.1 hypothetical protein CTRU02_09667 [Colletotrichum truncatum]